MKRLRTIIFVAMFSLLFSSVMAYGAFTTSDLQGTWNFHGVVSGDAPQWMGWFYGQGTADASGNFTFQSIQRSNGDTTLPLNTTLVINSDGIVTDASTTSFHGAMNIGKDLIAVTMTDDGGGYTLMIMQKAGGSFASSDLQGTWNFHAVDSGDAPQWLGWFHGQVSSDASGNLTFLSYLDSDGDTALPTAGPLAITSNGIVTEIGSPSFHGAMNIGKDLIAVTMTDDGGGYTLMIMQKAGAGQCVQPPSDLISWWPGDGNGNDIAGTNNGTLINGTTFVAGMVGQAFSLDGVDDEVLVPHNSNQNTGGQITIDAWVNPSSYGHGRPIAQKRSSSNVGGYTFETTHSPWGPDNGLQFVIWIGGTPYTVQTLANVVAVDTWQHIAATFDGVTMKIYVNGIEKASTLVSGVIDASTDPLVIGRNVVYPLSYLWQGFIDEVELFNRALSQAEIQAIYNAGSAGKCKPTCVDNDGDGYGNPGDPSCPNGSATDCDDNDPLVNPGATEGPYGSSTCSDNKDNNCNGKIDAADPGCFPPDLLVSSWTAPSNACAAATISIKDTTKNQGTGIAGASTTKFYFSTNTTLDAGDTPLGSRSVPSLNPATISRGTTSVTLPNVAIGKYYLIAMADDGKVVPESNETNNKKSKAIYIGPDLIVSTLTAPTSAARGTTISIGDTTKNKGCSAADASTTKFYLSTNTTIGTGDIDLGARTIPSLGTNAISSGTTNVTIPSGIALGKYYIIANSDDGKVVAEGNETNNKKTKAITIQ